MVDKLPTSTGEFTGFLNHQQQLIRTKKLAGGWTNSFERYESKLIISPGIRGENKKIYLSCHHRAAKLIRKSLGFKKAWRNQETQKKWAWTAPETKTRGRFQQLLASSEKKTPGLFVFAGCLFGKCRTKWNELWSSVHVVSFFWKTASVFLLKSTNAYGILCNRKGNMTNMDVEHSYLESMPNI